MGPGGGFFWLFGAMMLSLPHLQNWLSVFTCCAQCPIPGWEGAIFQGVMNSLVLGKKPLKMALPSRRLFSCCSLGSYFPSLINILKKVIINQIQAHLAKFNVYEKFMSTFRLHDSPKASLNKFYNDLLLMANSHYLFEV